MHTSLKKRIFIYLIQTLVLLASFVLFFTLGCEMMSSRCEGFAMIFMYALWVIFVLLIYPFLFSWFWSRHVLVGERNYRTHVVIALCAGATAIMFSIFCFVHPLFLDSLLH